MRDTDPFFAESGVDPIVLALALALTARRPVSLFSRAGESTSTASRSGSGGTTGAPLATYTRAVRPRNRKG